jgi:hypothetical protein
VYSLEYNDISRVLFTAGHVGCFCTNTIIFRSLCILVVSLSSWRFWSNWKKLLMKYMVVTSLMWSEVIVEQERVITIKPTVVLLGKNDPQVVKIAYSRRRKGQTDIYERAHNVFFEPPWAWRTHKTREKFCWTTIALYKCTTFNHICHNKAWST